LDGVCVDWQPASVHSLSNNKKTEDVTMNIFSFIKNEKKKVLLTVFTEVLIIGLLDAIDKQINTNK